MRLDAVKELRPKIRCREITASDIDAVAELLTRGFVGRSRDYWMQGLRRQAEREVPQGYPRFGYMLDNEGAPAGVLLLLYSTRTERRRNLDPLQSVELVRRARVPQLRADADQDRAAPQGSHLSQYQPGDLDLADHRSPGLSALLQRIVLFASRAVARGARDDGRDRARRCKSGGRPGDRRRRALDPARGLWLPQPGLPHGHRWRFPFILLPMRIRRGWIAPPAMQLIYCRDIVGIYRLRRRDWPDFCFGAARFR